MLKEIGGFYFHYQIGYGDKNYLYKFKTGKVVY